MPCFGNKRFHRIYFRLRCMSFSINYNVFRKRFLNASRFFGSSTGEKDIGVAVKLFRNIITIV